MTIDPRTRNKQYLNYFYIKIGFCHFLFEAEISSRFPTSHQPKKPVYKKIHLFSVKQRERSGKFEGFDEIFSIMIATYLHLIN